MTHVTIVSQSDTTEYGSASCTYILTFVSLSPIPSHIKKQSKLYFYILKTNQYFTVRSIIYVLQVSEMTTICIMTIYQIQTDQGPESMHKAQEQELADRHEQQMTTNGEQQTMTDRQQMVCGCTNTTHECK